MNALLAWYFQKQRLSLLLLLGAVLAAGVQSTLAQGKVAFRTDTLHLVYYDLSIPSVGGSAVYVGNTTINGCNYTFMADLYMGTDSSNLYLYSSTTFSATPGQWNNLSVLAQANATTGGPAIPGGTQVYVITQIRDANATPPSTWSPTSQPFGDYYGVSQEFTFILGSGITYPVLWSQTIGTWPIGTFNLSQYGTGGLGAIPVRSALGPFIYSQPVSQVAVIGTAPSFSVSAGPSVTYQWQRNGTNINAASGSSLVLNNVQVTDAGPYRVLVTNAYGTLASSNAVLQVLPTNGPSIQINSEFAVGTVIAISPGTVTMSGGFNNGFIFYTLDGTAPTTSSSLYDGPLTVSSNATIQAMSLSSDFSQSATSPAVNFLIVPTYALQTSVSGSGAVNPSSGTYPSNTVVMLTATPGQGWYFDHWAGDLTGSENPASVTMNGPRNVQAVFSQIVYFDLQTSISGSGSVNPSGGTYASNTVVTITATPAGGWSFVHWAGDLAGNTNPASLVMNTAKNVQVIFAETAYPLTVTAPGGGLITVNGQTNPPQMYFSPSTFVTLAAWPSNGWSFLQWQGTVTSTNNPLSLAMNQSNYVVAVFGTTVGTNISGNGSVFFNPPNPVPYGATVTATAVPGSGYYFVTWSQAATGTNNPTTFAVNTPTPTVGALFANSSASPPSIMQQPSSRTILVGSNTTFSVGAIGTAPLNYQWRKGGVPVGGALLATYTITAATTNDAGAYDVMVSNGYGSATSAVATLTVVLPVSITAQPTNQIVASGTSARFSLTADGTQPLFYQWRNLAGDISGATNSSLTLPSVSTNDTGPYSVVVSNPYSSVTSSVATLTVYIPVSITAQPVSQVVPAGATATFNFSATGYPSPAYQWFFEGQFVPGATSTNLVITNVGTNALGNYWALAYNPYSSATTSVAALLMSPSIRSPFLGATVIWGKSATLSVGAIGSGNLLYQWYKNGVAVTGATNSSLTFSAIQLSDGGLYSVVVCSEWGCVTNVAAQVVVNPANISLDVYAGITIDGVVGYTYGIEYTTDLTDTNSWVALTNVTLTQPIEIWVDTSVDVLSTKKRFYRVTAQ